MNQQRIDLLRHMEQSHEINSALCMLVVCYCIITDLQEWFAPAFLLQ